MKSKSALLPSRLFRRFCAACASCRFRWSNCLIRARSRLSRSVTSPSQSTMLHEGKLRSIGSKQSRPYSNSKAENPVVRRTEMRSAQSAKGKQVGHESMLLLQYFERELTIAE